MINESTDQFIEALKNTASGKQATAEIAQRLVIERQHHADALAKMEREADRDIPKRRAELERLAKERDAIAATLREAVNKVQAHQGKLTSDSLMYSHHRSMREAELIETASPDIQPFMREMQDEVEKTRKLIDYAESAVVNELTRETKRSTTNNAASVNARVAAIRAAIDEAAELRFRPDQAGVAQRLASLRAGLPKVEPVFRQPEAKR